MMDELIRNITEKTGLNADQAKAAAQTVLEFLKGRLPAPLASNLDSIIGGQAGAGSASEGLTDKVTSALGGLFGKGA